MIIDIFAWVERELQRHEQFIATFLFGATVRWAAGSGISLRSTFRRIGSYWALPPLTCYCHSRHRTPQLIAAGSPLLSLLPAEGRLIVAECVGIAKGEQVSSLSSTRESLITLIPDNSSMSDRLRAASNSRVVF